MTLPRFLQFHTLHSYPAALLNRDDTSLAKRINIGGAVRTRVSSQCLKRHWRTADDRYNLRNLAGATAALRSRDTIERRVVSPLRHKDGISPEVADALLKCFNGHLYGGTSETSGNQPLLLGLPEVEFLQEQAAVIAAEHPEDPEAAVAAANQVFDARGDHRNNFKAFRKSARLPAGIEGALFGRMVTSDPAANIEAAVHVAHAFTVHREESESDYFSVVDDLREDTDGPSAAHIGNTEITDGLFYGYVVVDVPELVSNLEGCPAGQWQEADRQLAAGVVDHLARLIATVSPGAKLGSTAPYGWAELMLIEAGDTQPRSLAGAFREPAQPTVKDASAALRRHLTALDECYGAAEARRYMSLSDLELPAAARLTMGQLAEWAGQTVQKAQAE